MMTAGDLASAHIGGEASLTVTESIVRAWGETETAERVITGTVVRVQHNAGQTLLTLSSWSGALDPTHPITIETGA